MDDEFEELLDAGKLRKIRSWNNNMGLRLKTHRDHYIIWIVFDKSFAPLQWAHLPIHHIIGGNTCPTWVCHQTYGWAEISSGENIRLDERYLYSEILFKRLLESCAAKEVLKTIEGYEKIYRAVLQGGMVENNTEKREFYLPNNCVLVTKSRLKSLELENQKMKLTIFALNVELEEANKLLSDN